ncbi:MAG: GTP-binding protein [Pseudomonadales bacterium]|nr:GTP-binding protein [Pseudomonadales bacterium]
MIAKKICLLGSFAVGKTSMIKRFVDSIFSEKYHTTIGVKIDKKLIHCQDQDVQMLIWDIEGLDDFSDFKQSYLRGAAGFFLVIDSTRPDSLTVAQEIHRQTREIIGDTPFIALLSKMDLLNEQRVTPEDIAAHCDGHWEVIQTSAKTGENVDYAFHRLAEKILMAE